MVKKFSGLFSFLFLAFFPLLSQIPVDAVTAARLQQKLDSCVAAYDIPGISASLILPDDQYWNGASGLSDIYLEIPVDTGMVFNQASVTKIFVATVVFKLMEENLLSLDDSIGMYLPPINKIPGKTKIRNLLNHRSGIYEFLSHPSGPHNSWFNSPNQIWDHQLMLTLYSGNPYFAEGASFRYSNTNYVLLGMIIESITGNTFAHEFRERILVPHGLTGIFFPPEDEITLPRASGWTSFSTTGVYDTDALLILNDCFASMVFTAGALLAKSADVAKFTKLLFSGKIISESSLDIMKTCTNVNVSEGNGYGHGAMRYSILGKTYFGHSGDINGFTEMTICQLDDKTTLSLSINRNSARRDLIAAALLRVVDQLTDVPDLIPDENKISVYPNPATEETIVEFAALGTGDCRISLVNSSGRCVYAENVNISPSGAGSHRISLVGLPEGVYACRVSTVGATWTRPLLVIK